MNLKKINAVSVIANNISVGDKIPVGGSVPGMLNLSLEIDKIPDDLRVAFKKMRDNAVRINTPALEQWLHNVGADIQSDIYAHFAAFTGVFDALFPSVMADTPDKSNARYMEYSETRPARLSDLLHKNLFQCAECAIVAQLYLQDVGIDSKYVNGEFLPSATAEFGDAHSWNAIHTSNGDFVFDPANAIHIKRGVLPNISSVKLDNQQLIALNALLMEKRHVAFFPVENILTHKTTYYGYGDGMSVFPQQIVQNTTNVDVNFHQTHQRD